MRVSTTRTAFFVILCLFSASALAHELSGYAAAEGRFFFEDALFPEQERDNVSFAFQPEYYHESENCHSFLFIPVRKARQRRS